MVIKGLREFLIPINMSEQHILNNKGKKSGCTEKMATPFYHLQELLNNQAVRQRSDLLLLLDA